MNKVCSKCGEVKLLIEFNKDKSKRDGIYPSCKACLKEYRATNVEKIKEYYVDNSKQAKERSAKHYAANTEKVNKRAAKWHTDNPEKVKVIQARYRAANPEKCRASVSKYQKANIDKCRSIVNKRRAAKLQAIPTWLTQDDYTTMKTIYKEANRLTQDTGIKHHVDHIHPLRGRYIRGFHCPSNLQILTESENCIKSNKFTPYVESELSLDI